TGFHSFARWFMPWLGVSELEKAIVKILSELENAANRTIDALSGLQEEVSQVSKIALQNTMILDMLLSSKGGVCTMINMSCCVCVDQSGRINTDLN
ncbi:ERVV2 protein, partial [Pterocles burchelli]|nr:ERVV2 protein [Pterocles burchelli]